MAKLFKNPNKLPPFGTRIRKHPRKIINPQETQAPKPATSEPSKQTTASHESKKPTDGAGKHNNVPMEIDLLENLF
ncbi:hypothetical protein DSO57_1015853 [Entomophthora muscae]|uniref:Uncharacterized protein n=1 Tax=Entomophthora muscae TaxID=34485 RepID=A0ACC2UFT8_9FUNG|nr:hypothetical protein DSO57_1015853 [Entomophthora muscae]